MAWLIKLYLSCNSCKIQILKFLSAYNVTVVTALTFKYCVLCPHSVCICFLQ